MGKHETTRAIERIIEDQYGVLQDLEEAREAEGNLRNRRDIERMITVGEESVTRNEARLVALRNVRA